MDGRGRAVSSQGTGIHVSHFGLSTRDANEFFPLIGDLPPTETLCAHDGGEERREADKEGRSWLTLGALPPVIWERSPLVPKYTKDRHWGSGEHRK